MKKEYTVEQMAEKRWFYTFTDKNAIGESLIIELSECQNYGGNNSLPALRKKNGHMDRVLETYLNIETFVTDTEGSCYGRYNPQVKTEHNPETGNMKSVINFEWMFEATEENKQRLIDEVYRLASSAHGETATDKKIKKIYEYVKSNNIEVVTVIPEGWEILVGSMTAPLGSVWVSNMKPYRSNMRKKALLIIGSGGK